MLRILAAMLGLASLVMLAVHGAATWLDDRLSRRERVAPGRRDPSTGRPTGGGRTGGQPVDKWGKRGGYLRVRRAPAAGNAKLSTRFPHDVPAVIVRTATYTVPPSTYPPGLLPQVLDTEPSSGGPS